MKVFIALVACAAATAALAEERNVYDIILSGPSVERRLMELEHRMQQAAESREAQRETERRLDSIFYPTPRESCINWALDCYRASRGR